MFEFHNPMNPMHLHNQETVIKIFKIKGQNRRIKSPKSQNSNGQRFSYC